MTTIETKIARAKASFRLSMKEALTLLPDLASECERLRALVESAPHEEDCPNDYVISTEGRVHRCTCWKRNLNQPTP